MIMNRRSIFILMILIFLGSFLCADDRISSYKKVQINSSMYFHGSNWNQILKNNDTLFLRYKCFKYGKVVLISDLIFEINNTSGEKIIIGSISINGVFNSKNEKILDFSDSVSNLVGFPDDVVNTPFDINGIAKNLKTGELYITENLCMLIINSNLSLDLWFPW